MYFCEQGSWDQEKRTYLRVEGQFWNETSRHWEDKLGKSPFESIPACFWWAIVTATTVGYGDMFPTTPAGKAVAGVSMAWSLCVLALPIGVIGNNFSTVWEEYDKEKQKDMWNLMKEDLMIKRSMAWGDPLHYSRRILLEVWHDPGLNDDDQAEFMGEVEVVLDMPDNETVTKKITAGLVPNYEKARRRVRGNLTFEYTWTPSSIPTALLAGSLEVNVISGDDLISIDWKGSCSSDPYCVVVAYPRSPGPLGNVEPVWHRSVTVWDTSEPKWNEKSSFEVHWTKIGTANAMAADMRRSSSENGMSNSMSHRKSKAQREKEEDEDDDDMSNLSEECSDKEKKKLMCSMVPDLRRELTHLQKKVVPQISTQICDVQKDLQLILAVLRNQNAFTDSVANGVVSAESAKQVTPDSCADITSDTASAVPPWAPTETR